MKMTYLLRSSTFFFLMSFLLFQACDKPTTEEPEDSYFGLPTLLAGEPQVDAILLQARLVASDTLIDNDLPGREGFARFELSTDADFKQSKQSSWMPARPENDYIIKWEADSLEPNQRYYYKIAYGSKEEVTTYSHTQTFKTLPGKEKEELVSFVMVTGSHYERFYMGGNFGKGKPSSQGAGPYTEADAGLGFPNLEAIESKMPDFYIGNGDNVYYDHPGFDKATKLPEMRAKWHRLFNMDRMTSLMGSVPAYWMKDDHDHRFDDSDTLPSSKKHGNDPSHELGVNTFIEQVPVPSKTYRTHRISKDLQIWMAEGRDFRSPNNMEDGPEKTMWGKEQMAWLKNSLLESDATFKLLVTPTPMVGPDDKRKTDNHTNPGGFKVEGDAFFDWLKANGFLQKNFYILCGDRHWQYHSTHPSGFEEFSCGSQVDQNSRLGKLPGDENSTDPEGLIQQPYTSKEPSGGFLMVKLGYPNDRPVLRFEFFDEKGNLLYETEKVKIRAH
ncbi:alkaline phosphatase D family protein [Flammeovirgaceae bacterium SG7u.111]|nr:alkaline phosphatase D family protein [Flammeovirgaceae bacterium SG7u.132]WPO38477.1 alkaline phosphatase D family protein [Flammeovirgaceae bacterium SG7u.111]